MTKLEKEILLSAVEYVLCAFAMAGFLIGAILSLQDNGNRADIHPFYLLSFCSYLSYRNNRNIGRKIDLLLEKEREA